ncbi:MAG: protein-tyrosine phosphatase [Arcticibacterium sp.]|jgi:protein-tyrosine phosphatase
MFSFFKPKAILKDLIPNNYIDIHSHMLPGIDDGASTLEQTEALLSKVKNMGFSKCIMTPHTLPEIWENTTEGIKQTFMETKANLETPYKEMMQGAASEYMINDAFMSRLDTEPLLTLKDNYILIEMSYLNPPFALIDIIYEIKHKGYQPILAHPERYLFYHNDLKMYDKIKDLDVLFQLNLLSSVGYYGTHISKVSDYLLHADLIDFVGSDIHHQRHVNAFNHKIAVKSSSKLSAAIERNQFFIA